MSISAYLSGEIHTNWRSEIITACSEEKLHISFLSPILDHDLSDSVGTNILGEEVNPFWKDHKSAKINAIRIRTLIEKADIVIVKFGEKYRQWNAAFDAGYAVAKGKPLIVLHSGDLIHPLKEIDAAAMSVAEKTEQVVSILRHVVMEQGKTD